MPRRVLLSTIVAVSVLAGGCSTVQAGVAVPAFTPNPESTSVPTSTSAPGTSTSSAPPTEGGSPAAVDFTKQGTKLRFNAKAVVPFKSSGKEGAIGVNVTGIDKGASADLAQLKLGDKANGLTPYYVRITVSNESGTADFAYSSISLIRGLLPDDSDAQGVSVIGKFDKCNDENAGKQFTTVGATYQTCVLALAPASTAVVGATYNLTSYGTQVPNTDYSTAPISWKP